jgi:K+-sensing histidine kinase KdpD
MQPADWIGDRTEEFVAGIAHDVRAPLATLHAALDTLLADPEMSRQQRDLLLRQLQHNVLWMDLLIENLTTWGGCRSGRVAAPSVRLSVSDWLEPPLALVEPILAKRHQRVCLRLPERAPLVNGDPTQLGQVMMNLLTNASRYGPPDDDIEVGVAHTEGGIRVSVRDHGAGVPAGEAQQIFQPFVRGSNALQRGRGQGLGLHIVREIVSRHGGMVGVESAAGDGATFWFTLPTPSAGSGTDWAPAARYTWETLHEASTG